jgi:hypothetical protein
MPIALKKMADHIGQASFKFLGDDVHVEYKLGAIEVTNTDFRDDEDALIHDLLERVLVSWDVLDEQNQPIPTTAQAMRDHRIPTPFLRDVWRAIVEDTTPGKLRKSR